jgi:hypothetical protein
MGYELIFHYKEAESPGVYKDEIKNKSYKIGKVTEEIGLDVLAGKILSQLARRNILIVDLEIYEYAKKKLSYRETNDGIVLKNKKFSFDSGVVVTAEDFDVDQEEQVQSQEFRPLPSPSRELADKSCPIVQRRQNSSKRAIRHEVFDPDPIGLHKINQKGLKFTMGKKYPIYSEESLGSNLIYNTSDDSGSEVKVSAEYFVALGQGLIEADEGPKYVGAENQKEEINLWGKNYESNSMPDIRSR